MSQNPYQQPFENPANSTPYQRAPKKHGIVGILSFIAAMIGGLLSVAGVIFATIIVTGGNVSEESPQLAIVGLGIMLGMFIHFVGGTLGLIGVFIPNTKRMFAIIGLALNGLILLGVLGLMLIGSIAG